ncbi:MAG TPA: WbqC family protein [Candidatus Nitrosotalea sp.]|nr:WbqC family protein [Candidatus Nitrosotalea sp.]
MKAVVHQPQYFPYPGFFHKLSQADVYVIMDKVQYDKRFTNRNKIIATNGWTWITVPIKKDHMFMQNMDVEINNELSWAEIHWKKIHQSYANAKYFNLYKDYLESLYKKEWNSLFELDFQTIKKTIEWLGIKIDIVKESELNIQGRSTERLINACKAVGADTYLSGTGGKNYIDEKLFEKYKIKFEYQNYHPVPYRQRLAKSFIPDLSIIDLLVNVGPDSLDLITSSGKNLLTLEK